MVFRLAGWAFFFSLMEVEANAVSLSLGGGHSELGVGAYSRRAKATKGGHPEPVEGTKAYRETTEDIFCFAPNAIVYSK